MRGCLVAASMKSHIYEAAENGANQCAGYVLLES